MAQENVKKLQEKIANDEALQAQLDEIMAQAKSQDEEIEKLVAFGEAQGLPFTPEECKEVTQKLSLDELDNVAGGTRREMRELGAAYNSRVPWYKELTPDGVVMKLREMGIETNSSWGILGTGINSVNNTYKEIKTGKMLLHEEVVEFLRTGRKVW